MASVALADTALAEGAAILTLRATLRHPSGCAHQRQSFEPLDFQGSSFGSQLHRIADLERAPARQLETIDGPLGIAGEESEHMGREIAEAADPFGCENPLMTDDVDGLLRLEPRAAQR